jgi:CubicO group peptidase (beta-lactamase class C family)
VRHHNETVFAWFRRHGGADRVAHLHSITKSIVGALVGISGIDISRPVVSFFPELTIDDERKATITVEHLLAMTSGLDWPEWEQWGYVARPLQTARDKVRLIMDRPLVETPGSRMWYSTGSSHLLGVVLSRATGKSLETFAAESLFRPLRINRWRFYADSQGHHLGGNGLDLCPTDLAVLGSALMADTLIPLAWMHQCWTPRTSSYPAVGAYGWHWWIDTNHGMCFGLGIGGQVLALLPDQDLVIVTTTDPYGDAMVALRLIRESLSAG